uniref:Uncharacterized protein n=1 Tax=Arundo donax TaxID=35708 RepID=A0A0A9DGN8_ARUDO
MCRIRKVQLFMRKNRQRGGEEACIARTTTCIQKRRHRNPPRVVISSRLPHLVGRWYCKTWWTERIWRSLHHCIRLEIPFMRCLDERSCVQLIRCFDNNKLGSFSRNHGCNP